MSEAVVEGQTNPEGMPISAIFSLEGMGKPEYRNAVVNRVLSEFSRLSKGVQGTLRSAVNEEIIPTTGGFRRGQAGRALGNSNFLLQEPVQQALILSDALSIAVLRCWAESHASLREKVEHHLVGRGMDSSGPNLQEKLFTNFWPTEEWKAEQDAFSQAHQEFEQDDIAVMLCYVSGRFPLESNRESDAGYVGSTLSAALFYLRELPPTAPEWEQEIPNFVASVSSLIEEKASELLWSANFDAVVETVNAEFSELMQFFEMDTQKWKAARVSQEAESAATLALAERLQYLLAEYQPFHERASGISEERERSRKRDELQSLILNTLQEIDGLMAEDPDSKASNSPEEPQPDGPATPEDSPVPEEVPEDLRPAPGPSGQQPIPEREPPHANPLQEALPVSDTAVAGRAVAAVAVAEPPAIEATEYTALRSENLDLRNGADALSAENQDLRDELESLKGELYGSQEMEESWRLAYLSSREGYSQPDETTALSSVDSVSGAVEMAKERFKKELTFAPNSESSIESNPFVRPEKVWEALQWLATIYYKSKMGRLRVTNFDQSIKEACGWWYKSDQGETTVSRYRKSYTARAYGKTYRLEEHIGKGTNFDARYTIRIAFDWDDDLRQVIIGYIGRHQQTDAS